MALIADAVLLVHFGVVIFIAGGLVLVPFGHKLGWSWIGHKRLRIIHAGAMTFVALETLMGLTCPLTLIENYLSGIVIGLNVFFTTTFLWNISRRCT